MANILAISSQVVRGHVGNSAMGFTLQRLGHRVWAVPTIVLSNHPGHPHCSGIEIAPEAIAEMMAALQRNGWAQELDAVITGYLPTAEHVAVARDMISLLRAERHDLVVLCDPVLGDDPRGLYIAHDAAVAIRDTLVPLADIVTPNRFELAWLSGVDAGGLAEGVRAGKSLGVPSVLATSLAAPRPKGEDSKGEDRRGLCNALIDPSGCFCCEVPQLQYAPNGTGDYLSALFLGFLLQGAASPQALALATAGVKAALECGSTGRELALVDSQDRWASPAPWPVTRLG